ncbi:hypothetical protein FE257_002852 [Aspergillus nanangensis]|uniref:Uncharacterized protein n=1 Tax=Aspergillus nanangensis TaxID=2582783 RepID=A0AAD4CSG4_ASPNN|nr:hypothetical protein FE257_002852 [Aspergillus nanangensis]
MAETSSKFALGRHRGPDPEVDDNVEKGVSLEKTETTRTQKIRRHWGRFWFCYCFASLIFLIIFLPIFFTLIIPAIAQRVVDDSNLVLVRADVMQPRPESVVLTIESALKLPLSVPVRIEPIALQLFNRDTKQEHGDSNGTFGTVFLPKDVIDGNTTLGVTDQLTPLDVEQWTKYVENVVFMEHAPLSVWGQTNSFLGVLKSFVTMDKDIKQNTLNSFAGFSIEDSTILFPPKDDGTNLIANATLPNPSVLTLEIGKTVLDLKSGDLLIGNATIDNLILRPGNHSSPVHGILDLGVLISNLGDVIRTQRDSLTNGYLSLDTVGRSATYDGVEVPYYTKALQNLTMTAQVPIAGLLKNTLRNLIGGNATNLASNLEDSGVDLSSVLDNFRGSDAEKKLKGMVNKRSVDQFVNHPEKREMMLNLLEAFL